MDSIRVFVEIGKKKLFAGAADWPGWCRYGRDEEAAIQALIDYGPRYAQALQRMGIEFQAPVDISKLDVTERHYGNSTTDFGAPAISLDGDREPIERAEMEHLLSCLEACWRAFDSAVGRAGANKLRKGARGGGRDTAKIIEHVVDAEKAYLGRLAWKHKSPGGLSRPEALSRTRQAIRDALEAALAGSLPERGPRGGVLWPPRYFVRRVAWHVLDHAWEIEDRVV